MSDLVDDDLTLIVTPAGQSTGGRELSGWQEVRVTRNCERLPNDFAITMTERFPGESQAFVVQPGDFCEVLLGPDLVLSGYVDEYSPAISVGDHTVRVSGRGKCQDLVDCSAIWEGGQISGSSALQVAQKLAAAYGIEVTSDVDGQLAIPQFNLMYGDTSVDLIERICRYSALLYYETTLGGLFLTIGGTDEAASGFVEGVNIEAAYSTFSSSERFSRYNAYALPIDTLGDTGFDGNLLASLTDPGVLRRREKSFTAETVGGAVSFNLVQQRVAWEMNRRNGRSRRVAITTDSWRDEAGKLWEPNTLVDIVSATLKIDTVAASEKWLIGSVSYTRDASGTHAQIIAMPPAAFDPQPRLLQPDFPDVPYLNGAGP